MRFEFCGNTSLPQWFIAEISVLPKITAIKIKLIFSQMITYYLESSDISTKVQKLLSGTGLDFYQMYALVSTLQFILTNCVANQVDQNVLHKQLIDLGLPRQNVESIVKTYKANKEKLFSKSNQKFLKLSQQVDITGVSVHEFVGSGNIGKAFSQQQKPPRFIECRLNYKNIDKKQCYQDFMVDKQMIEEMTFSLQEALKRMQNIQNVKKIN